MARWIALGWLVMLPACSPIVKGTYDPGRFADWPIDPAKKLDGCVTLSTTAEEDAFVWRGGPKGPVAKTVTLEVPLGVITREAAARVFGDLFRGGAAKDSGPAGADRCGVAIAPRAMRFAWVDHVFSRPEFEVSIRIETRSSGETILSKDYSGTWRAVAQAREKIAAESVVPASHLAVQSLMLRAAGDVKAALDRARPPGGGTDAPARPPGG